MMNHGQQMNICENWRDGEGKIEDEKKCAQQSNGSLDVDDMELMR